MNAPDDVEPRATVLQREALARLVGLQRALVMMPPGTGKTVVAGLQANELAKDGKPVLTVFFVQNRDLLKQATKSLKSVRKIDDGRVRGVYDLTASLPLYAPDVDLIAASRTAGFRDIDKLIAATRDFDGHIQWVMDEAHHLGKKDGEFDYILNRINQSLRPQDVLLGLSATPWHTNLGPIHTIFHDNLVTVLVSEAERLSYLASGKLIELARLVLFRAMAAGYLSPISSYRHVEYEENGRSVRDYLYETEVEMSRLTPPDARRVFKRDIQIHLPFLERVLKEIKDTFEFTSTGEATYYNRGVIFVPSIAQAEAYAEHLNKLSGRGQKIRFRAYHSDLSSKARDNALEWFDEGDRRHKYLIAIGTLGEAFDRKGLNHVMLARPYSVHDEVGMRDLIQHLGRPVRVGSGKTRVWVTDFTGDMRRLLFEQMDQRLIASTFTENGAREYRMRITDQSTNLFRIRGDGFRGADVHVPPRPPVPKIDDQRPWTLARLLLDERVIPGLLPGTPPTPRGSYRSLGYYVCQAIKGAQVMQRPADNYGYQLMHTLGLSVIELRELGLDRILRPHCHRKMFATPPTGARLLEAETELTRLSPGILGREVHVRTSDFTGETSLLNRPGLFGDVRPLSKRPPDRWTLAEVLLHPLIPALLGVRAPNLAQLILDGGYDHLPYAKDWDAITWRDRLETARSYDLLHPAPVDYLYGPSAGMRASESLTTIDPALFERRVNFTEQDLYRLARSRPVGDPARRQAEGELILWSFNVRDVKDVDKPVSLAFAHLTTRSRPDVAKWRAPWSAARILVHPLAANLSLEHARVVESLRRSAPSFFTVHSMEPGPATLQHIDANERAALARLKPSSDRHYYSLPHPQFSEEGVMDALARATHGGDRDQYAELTDYVRRLGPVPPRQSTLQFIEPVDVGGTWTVARLLIEPAALRILFPDGTFEGAARARLTLADYLCAEVAGSGRRAFGEERGAIAKLLEVLGISSGFRARGDALSSVRRACDEDAFGPPLHWRDQRVSRPDPTRDELRARERALIMRAPSVFGARTRLTDADLRNDRTPLLARAPLIPELNPRAENTGPLTRNYTLAQFLLSPYVAWLADVPEVNLATHLLARDASVAWIGSLRIAGTYGLTQAGGAAGFMDADGRLRGMERLRAIDPSTFLTKVAFSDFDLYHLSRNLSPARRRVIETYLISRGFTEELITRAARRPRQLPDLQSLVIPTDAALASRDEAFWRTPWTLARLLVHPLTAIISNQHSHATDGVRRAGNLATWATSSSFDFFTSDQRGQSFPMDWDLSEVIELLNNPEVRAVLRDQPLLSVEKADVDRIAAAERHLLSLDPELFGRPVAAFNEERVVRALKSELAESRPEIHHELTTYLASLGSPPVAEGCGDLLATAPTRRRARP